MIKRTFNLCITLGEDGKLNEDLIISNSLYKLDEYIKNNFNSHRDVRKKYDSLIGEFCLDNMDRIINENMRNEDNRTGNIVILEKDYNEKDELVGIKRIKVIYGNSELLSRSGCIKKIKKELEKDNKLKKLRKDKAYLLSKNEMDLIDSYFNYHNNKRKSSAIAFLTKRIEEESSVMAYYDCRCLARLCNLVRSVVKTSKVTIKNISDGIPKRIEVVKENTHTKMVDSDDLLKVDYFDTLIEQGDDEELYNLYSIDEIQKRKGRR